MHLAPIETKNPLSASERTFVVKLLRTAIANGPKADGFYHLNLARGKYSNSHESMAEDYAQLLKNLADKEYISSSEENKTYTDNRGVLMLQIRQEDVEGLKCRVRPDVLDKLAKQSRYNHL